MNDVTAVRRTRGPLLHNTLWALGGQATRLVASAATFVVAARALGPEQLGAVVAVSSVMWIVGPFAGLGFGMLLLQRVARNRSAYAGAFGDALAATLLTGTVLLALATAVGRLVLPASILLVVFIAIGFSELVVVRILEVCAQAFQAHARMREAAVLHVLLSLSRLVAVLVLLLGVADPSARDWSLLQLGGTSAASALGLLWTVVLLGPPEAPRWRAASGARSGVLFSLGLASQSIYNDIDKAMLSRLVSLSAAGLYGTSYKFVEIAFAPVRSLLLAAASTLFAKGADGTRAAFDYLRRLFPLTGAYALSAGMALALLAPFTPALLGPGYADAVGLIRALAVLPIIRIAHAFAADTLGASGHQGIRSGIQIAVAAANVALNAVLLPRYGVWGAVSTSIACELLLLIAMWTALHTIMRRESLAPRTL